MQRHIEGLHAALAAAFHGFLDGVHFAFEDEIGDVGGVDQDLDGGAAFAVGGFDQAL